MPRTTDKEQDITMPTRTRVRIVVALPSLASVP
jgi:hypothetical protein